MKKYDNSIVKGLVSIIIPIYNGEEYITRCMDSILNQSYKNIETILIDDGSTDTSGKICDKYAIINRKIRTIHTKNQGPAAARNKGMENSNGELIFFLDIDDFLENDSINLLMEKYEKYNADLIVGDFKKFDENDNFSESRHNNVFSESKLLTKEDILDYVEKYLKKPNRLPLFVYSWGRLFKSSIIKENNLIFNPDLHTFEDVAFNFDYLKHTNELFFLNKPICNHQIYENYSSATMAFGENPKKLFGYKQALVNIRDFLEDSNSNIDIKRAIGHADVCYTIIQLVRTCGQINKENKKKIHELVYEIVNDSKFRNNIQYYTPTRGDSKVVPVLINLKLVKPIIEVCKHKAYKRYKKTK